MVVILLDDLVKERGEGVEALVAARVDTDARVGPLAAREDALLECEAILVLAVLAVLPDVAREHLGQERLGAAGEHGELGDLRGAGKVGTHHHAIVISGTITQLCEAKESIRDLGI